MIRYSISTRPSNWIIVDILSQPRGRGGGHLTLNRWLNRLFCTLHPIQCDRVHIEEYLIINQYFRNILLKKGKKMKTSYFVAVNFQLNSWINKKLRSKQKGCVLLTVKCWIRYSGNLAASYFIRSFPCSVTSSETNKMFSAGRYFQ